MARMKPTARVTARTSAKSTRETTRETTTKSPDSGTWGGISSAAVEKATGRGWPVWFREFDRAGAAKLSHKAIAQLAHERFAVPPWWSQMVTVVYEQARGLRKKHQTAEGYSVSGTRTIAAPAREVWRAFEDKKLRARWIPGTRWTVTTATEPKSMRILWNDDTSRVDVMLYAKGAGRTMLSVQHRKIGTEKEAKRQKAWWSNRLDALKTLLEDS